MLRISQASNAWSEARSVIVGDTLSRRRSWKRRVRRQANRQADGLAQPLGIKGVGQMPVIQPWLHMGSGEVRRNSPALRASCRLQLIPR